MNDLPFDLSKVGGSVSNFISKPYGTDYVSTVDDAIRATREHFVECLKKISGYPEVDTVCVKIWDNATKPNGHSCGNDRVLLGYNSDLNALEVITNNGSIMEVGKAIALLVHPVGSYYETSDATFDPNTAWGGTWVLDTPGRVMVSQGRKKDANDQVIAGSHNFEAGEIGGEETHSLSRPELPSVQSELPIHYHPHRHPHSHDVSGFFKTAGQGETPDGYLASTGTVGVKVGTIKSGLPKQENYAYSMGIKNNQEIGWFSVGSDYSLHGMVDADTVDTQQEDTRTVSEDLIMHVGSSVGQNGHNNLQPYKVCYRWHRTA